MKKMIALFSSLLIFAGVKAQDSITIKKETVKPLAPAIPTDSLQIVKPGSTVQQNNKAIKFDHIKKAPVQVKLNPVPLKDPGTTTKPHKD